MEILNRLELKESVSVDELIYLHKQAKFYPEVNSWLNKLLKSEFLADNEINYPSENIAA